MFFCRDHSNIFALFTIKSSLLSFCMYQAIIIEYLHIFMKKLMILI